MQWWWFDDMNFLMVMQWSMNMIEKLFPTFAPNSGLRSHFSNRKGKIGTWYQSLFCVYAGKQLWKKINFRLCFSGYYIFLNGRFILNDAQRTTQISWPTGRNRWRSAACMLIKKGGETLPSWPVPRGTSVDYSILNLPVH